MRLCGRGKYTVFRKNQAKFPVLGNYGKYSAYLSAKNGVTDPGGGEKIREKYPPGEHGVTDNCGEQFCVAQQTRATDSSGEKDVDREWLVTELSRSGLPDAAIVALLGWESADMIKVYSDIPKDEALARYFGGGKLNGI